MALKELTEMVGRYMSRFFIEKFTGRIVITFHFRQGGVGKTEVEIKQDMKKWNEEQKNI